MFNIVHYSVCFIDLATLTLVENSLFFVFQFLNFFAINILTSVPSHPILQKAIYSAAYPSYIIDCLICKVAIPLCCQLGLTSNIAVQIKNFLRSTSVIKVATMIFMDDFHHTKDPLCATTKSTVFAVSKNDWNTIQRLMYCTYTVCIAACHLSESISLI